MLQFGASLTDDASSVNYDHNMFIIKATGLLKILEQAEWVCQEQTFQLIRLPSQQHRIVVLYNNLLLSILRSFFN
jgi:hypothetical protein